MAVELLTFGEMVTEFGYEVGELDLNNTRWVEVVRKAWINAGQLDFVQKTRCLEKTFTSTVAADTTDVELDQRIFADGMYYLSWVDSDDDETRLDEYHPAIESGAIDEGAAPSRFYRVGNTFYFDPYPNVAGSLKTVGQRKPDELSATTDQSLIPATWRRAPVLFAVAKAHREDGETNSYMMTMGEYNEQVKDCKRVMKMRRKQRKPGWRIPRTIRMRP